MIPVVNSLDEAAAAIVDAVFDAGYAGSLVREGRFGADPRGEIGRSVACLRGTRGL